MGDWVIATLTLLRAGRERIDRLGSRLGPGTGGFFAWWARALAGWLPRRWRQALGLDRGRLLLVVPPAGGGADESLSLRVQDSESIRELGRVARNSLPSGAAQAASDTPSHDPLDAHLPSTCTDLPRWLLLPATAGLRRQLSLPAAAGDRLREVLAFEISRQTPFDQDKVAYDARVLGRHADGHLKVELVVVPQATLAAQRAVFGQLTETLAGIDMADDDGLPLGVNLLPASQRRRIADPWRYWNLALATIAVLALAMGLWQLLDNRRDAADAFAQSLDARGAKARDAAAQYRQLLALVDGQGFLDRQRAGRPSSVEVLDELSRLLPDSTYLEKISMEGERLLLIGLSDEASALVGRLEASELWQAPALAGALLPDPSSGRDRFTIVAELARNNAPAQPAEAATDGNR